MSVLGQKMVELRKKKSLSQTDLAQKVGLSYAQIGRYETKGAQPPAEALKKIADASDTTVDYLIYGDTEEKAKASLKDSELLQQFKALEQLDDNDKNTIKNIIDAFVKRSKLNQIAAS